MKVLIVEPGYSPYEADIENTPASLTAVLESEQYTAAFPFDNTVIAARDGRIPIADGALAAMGSAFRPGG